MPARNREEDDLVTDPRNDHELAADLARDAGALLLDIRADFPADGDPRQLKSAGDMGAHHLLLAALAAARPGDAVLSEEGADNHERLAADRVWIVDPLDGTREFSERPRDDWAVHVALWQRNASGEGGELIAGAVAQPALGETFNSGPDWSPGRLPCRPAGWSIPR